MFPEFYIIHAHVIEDDQPDWIYATTTTRDEAEALAKRHCQMGKIKDDWTISKMHMDTSEQDDSDW